MSKNDTIKIGPFSFRIIDRQDNRVLLEWTEASGETKQRWVITNSKGGIL